jgi:hypothetical protein
MSLLSRLFGNRKDPRDKLRPLWHRVVESPASANGMRSLASLTAWRAGST